jgi:hypothetical protein
VLQAVLDGKLDVPPLGIDGLDFVPVDLAALKKLAKATKLKESPWPGITIAPARSVVVR